MKPDKTKLNKLKRRFYKHLWFFRPFSYLLITLAILFSLIWLVPKLAPFFQRLAKGPAMVISLFNPSLTHLNSSRQRTNILLLGMAGGDHPGADLTDSIMLISINLQTNDTVLISLPRDTWVESLSAKLNAAYHYGETKQPDGGLILAKAAASEIINQPIHYGILLDFSGFEKAIDIIGGLDLDVPHGFVDKKYPIPGKEAAEIEADRHQTIEFLSGSQHMNGATALKYVRSRNAEGEEGTDFARAQRQQRVILAFKNQLLSAKTFLNPKRLKQLNQIFKDSVATDIPSGSYPDLFKLALRIDKDNIRTGIIDQGSQSEDIPPLLYNPPASLYGQWVLTPVDNDWQPIFDHIEEIIYQNQ